MSLLTIDGKMRKYNELYVNRQPKLHPMSDVDKTYQVFNMLKDDIKEKYMKKITEAGGKESEQAERDLMTICLAGPKKLWKNQMLKTVGWRRGFTKAPLR